MPAINQYAFETLTHIANGAREAFLTAASAPESDIERYAGVTVAEAFSSTARAPEPMAKLADAYLTAMSGRSGQPFNGAFEIARRSLGRDDMVDGMVLHAALGRRPDPKSGAHYNDASYR